MGLIKVTTCRFVSRGERNNYHSPLPKQGTILASVGTEPFKGDKSSSMITLGIQEFKKLSVVAGGTLQRWNIALRKDISPEEAREEAKAQETAYIKEVKQFYNDLPEEIKCKCAFEIKGWDDYIGNENFANDLAELKEQLNKNEEWKKALDKSVKDYLDKHSNIKDKPKAEEYVKEYILEESAVFLRLRGTLMYPATKPVFQEVVFEYANKKFSLKDDEKLDWLQLRHKPIKVEHWDLVTPEKDKNYRDTAIHQKLKAKRAMNSSSPKSSPSSSPKSSPSSSPKASPSSSPKSSPLSSPKSSPSSSPKSSPSSSPKSSPSSSPKSNNAFLFSPSKENIPRSVSAMSKNDGLKQDEFAHVLDATYHQRLAWMALLQDNKISPYVAIKALQNTSSFELDLINEMMVEKNNYNKIQSRPETPISPSV